MAHPVTPSELYQQIRYDEQLRDSVIAASAEIVREYHGDNYRIGLEAQNPAPDNFWYDWFKVQRPKVVFSNPTVRVQSRKSGVHQAAPMAMQAALNWWVGEIDLRTTLDRVFFDSAFSYGVIYTRYEPFPGFEGAYQNDESVPHRPVARRIAPDRFSLDWDCDHWTEARRMEHVWAVDKADLLNDPRYNKEVVDSLPDDAEMRQKYRKGDRESHDGLKRVLLYEVWVPEINNYVKPDDPMAEHAHGTLFTLAVSPSQAEAAIEGDKKAVTKWVRDPRPFYGPSWGPYTLFGYDIVPTCPYPLAPFAAVYAQVKELNAHATALARAAANAKSFVLVDAAHAEARDTIEAIPDGGVATIKGLAGGIVQPVEINGATEAKYRSYDRMMQRVERATGVNDQARGTLDQGDPTATETADAAGQRENQSAMLKLLFTGATRQVIRTGSWYFHNQDSAAFPLPQEVAKEFVPAPRFVPPESDADLFAMQTGQPLEVAREALRQVHNPRVVFGGGPSSEPITPVEMPDGWPTYVVSSNAGGLRFEDMMYEIEPYSMEKVDNAVLQKRAQDMVGLVIQIVPLIAQYPFVNWKELLDRYGEPMNIRDLGQIINLGQLQ